MRSLRHADLVIATHNRGKVDEIAAMLSPFGATFVSAGDLGLPVPPETETCFVGNARIKAASVATATGRIALADDSGLAVDALDGLPGVWTADWAETPTGRDFGMAMARVVSELRSSAAAMPWTAAFHCALVVAWPDGQIAAFEGRVDGHIVAVPRGALGHGYDPIFCPEGSALTFGEMDQAQKNRMSHRARAFARLVESCFT